MENLEVIPNPWNVRATNPTNVFSVDAEGNLVPQDKFLVFEGVKFPPFFMNPKVSSTNAHQAIIVIVTFETVVKQDL